MSKEEGSEGCYLGGISEMWRLTRGEVVVSQVWDVTARVGTGDGHRSTSGGHVRRSCPSRVLRDREQNLKWEEKYFTNILNLAVAMMAQSSLGSSKTLVANRFLENHKNDEFLRGQFGQKVTVTDKYLDD